MRKILLGLTLFLSVICNGQIDKTENAVSATNDSNFLIGKWKESEYKGNDGATSYSTKIESGRIFIFEKDGSVVIEKIISRRKESMKLKIVKNFEYYLLKETLIIAFLLKVMKK